MSKDTQHQHQSWTSWTSRLYNIQRTFDINRYDLASLLQCTEETLRKYITGGIPPAEIQMRIVIAELAGTYTEAMEGIADIEQMIEKYAPDESPSPSEIRVQRVQKVLGKTGIELRVGDRNMEDLVPNFFFSLLEVILSYASKGKKQEREIVEFFLNQTDNANPDNDNANANANDNNPKP